MSRRVSSRLAAKETSSLIADKESTPQQLLSPTTSPTLTNGKAVGKKKAIPKEQTLHGKETATSPAIPESAGPTTKKISKKENLKDEVKAEEVTPPKTKGTKRKRAASAPKKEEEEDDDELPHNMGKRPAAKPKVKQEGVEEAQTATKTTRRPKPTKPAEQEEQDQEAKDVIEGSEAPPKKKRAKKPNPYGLTPGETPFPDWPHPTKEECQVVHDLLMSTITPERQERFKPPNSIPQPSEVVAGCGEVPSILDALMRTLLSAATSGKNSSASFQGLIQRFGKASVGVGKGSVDWNAVHQASHADVFQAIKCGGLAENKSKNIQKILDMVHNENQERLATLLQEKETGEPEDLNEEDKAERQLELHTLQQGILTLDYYHVLEKDDALSTFTNYPGIGVKTAACVNLFCMQRPCFAVDTHVFRLCQYLGWVPPDETRSAKQKKADRNTTFSHCEVRVPDELKYGLHQLFLEHGKNCPRCRAITGEKSEGWADANCVIEHLVKRLGKKKGGIDSPKKKGKKGKQADDNDEDED